MDVWIQAGGSNTWGDNGGGDGDAPSDSPCGAPVPEKIKMWSWPNQTWTDAVTNVHNVGRFGIAPSDAIGPDIPFARALLDLGLSKRVGFVPCAMGGTSMFAHWQPGNNAEYPRMVNQTRRAMRAIGKKGRLAGLVMMLGEGDAMLIYNQVSEYNPDGRVWSAEFGLLMNTMLTYLRKELADLNPNLPVIIALQAVQGRQRVFPWIQSVRDQISDMTLPSGNLVKADMEGCRIFQVDLSGLNGWLGIDASVGWQGIHLSRQGQCCMGQRMAAAYAQSLPQLTQQPRRSAPRINATLLSSLSWIDPASLPSPPPFPDPSPPPV